MLSFVDQNLRCRKEKLPSRAFLCQIETILLFLQTNRSRARNHEDTSLLTTGNRSVSRLALCCVKFTGHSVIGYTSLSERTNNRLRFFCRRVGHLLAGGAIPWQKPVIRMEKALPTKD